MELALPSILTDAEVVAFGGIIALLVGILQTLQFVPMPDGSRARAWAVSLASALFVGLATPGTEQSGTALALAVILSWIALASASLGLNRAGSFTVKAATDRAADPPGPQG